MSEANPEMKHSNGQITNMLDNINENLDMLTELIKDIEKKLSPITVIEDTELTRASEIAVQKDPDKVPMAFEMAITNDRIIREKQNLASLINRIEL